MRENGDELTPCGTETIMPILLIQHTSACILLSSRPSQIILFVLFWFFYSVQNSSKAGDTEKTHYDKQPGIYAWLWIWKRFDKKKKKLMKNLNELFTLFRSISKPNPMYWR